MPSSKSDDNPYVLVLTPSEFMVIFEEVMITAGYSKGLINAVMLAESRHVCKDDYPNINQHCSLTAVDTHGDLFQEKSIINLF